MGKKALITDGPLPHEYSRSSTKRIYESVFRIVQFSTNIQIDFDDNHQEEEFHTECSDDTNSSKIIEMLGDDNMLIHLYQKMKMEVIY